MSAQFVSPQAQIDALKAAIAAFDSGNAPGASKGAFLADRIGLVRDRIMRANNPKYSRANAEQLAALDSAISALRCGAMLPPRASSRGVREDRRLGRRGRSLAPGAGF